jgi:hypothetical protein
VRGWDILVTLLKRRKKSRLRNIHVISGLPDGLTEHAVKAAQKIKFKPATRDGKPVAMWMQLEYNFNLR